jgi:heat shock protein HtpX
MRHDRRLQDAATSLAALVGLFALLVACAWTAAGSWGVVIGAGAAILIVFMAPTAPPDLAMRFMGATPVGYGEFEELQWASHAIAEAAGLGSPPRLFIARTREINAVSAGTKVQSAIALSPTLIGNLTMREIIGVLAHEMSHISHADIHRLLIANILGRLAANLALAGLILNAFVVLSSGKVLLSGTSVVFLLIVPTLTSLLFLALSRIREFSADRGAIELTGDIKGLASAIARIELLNSSWQNWVYRATYTLVLPSLLRTHPPTKQRIKRIMEMADQYPSASSDAIPAQAARFMPPSSHHAGWPHSTRAPIGRFWL